MRTETPDIFTPHLTHSDFPDVCDPDFKPAPIPEPEPESEMKPETETKPEVRAQGKKRCAQDELDIDESEDEHKEKEEEEKKEEEKKPEEKKMTHKIIRMESYYGSFERSISVPAGTKSSDVSAKFENGVLTVKIAKPRKEEAKKIEIQ